MPRPPSPAPSPPRNPKGKQRAHQHAQPQSQPRTQHATDLRAHTGTHRHRETETDPSSPVSAAAARCSPLPPRHRSSSPTSPPPLLPLSSPFPPPASSSRSPPPSSSSTRPPSDITPRAQPTSIAAVTTSFSSSSSTAFSPPSVGPASTAAMPLTPARIRPLLRCPLCPSSPPLAAPVTLRCGHTLCADHARPDSPGRCPLPTCSAAPHTAALAPNPQSGVGYYTAPDAPDAHPDSQKPTQRVREGRTDVTLGKILELAERAQAWFDDAAAADGLETAPAYPPDADELTDSERERERDAAERDPEHDIEDLYFNPPHLPASISPAAGTPSPPDPSPSTSAGTGTRPRARRRSASPDAPSRPRKRRRRLRISQTQRAGPPAPANERDPAARFEKELMSELTCDICSQLFVQPVTAPCQHTFCAGCLHRSLDYNMTCPICRDALEYAYFQDHPCNKLVLAIILHTFPGAYAERRDALEAEERDARLDTPVMVAQLSYPGMPTMLHFFEPRYRLMLRRCLSTPNPRFGMIPPPRAAPSVSHLPPPGRPAPVPLVSPSAHHPQSAAPAPAPATTTGNEYGTMLEIRNVQMLPDGRAIVEAWGAWRFRIVERGTLDGYVVARIERLEDWEEDEEIHAAEVSAGARGRTRTIAELMGVCHAFLNELREGTPWVVHRLNTNYVAMPTDPASFSFWMGALLPIDEYEKAKLLPIRSARLRMRLVVHWIEKLQSQWARSYASASRLQVVLWWMRYQLMRAVVGAVMPAGLVGFVLALVAVSAMQAVGRLVGYMT